MTKPSALRRAAWRVQRFADDAVRAVRGRAARRYHEGRPLRIVMTLLVRDEADIVAATIEHALSLGVDRIIATDNNSTDGTTEILKAYADAGVLDYRLEPAQTLKQAEWVTRMAREAATAHDASWVVNADADEFLWAWEGGQRGALKHILGGIAPTDGLVGFPHMHFWADPGLEGSWSARATISKPGANFRAPVYDVWKVAHRADPDVVVGPGNHMVRGPRLGSIAPSRPLEVFHFPNRSYAQYAKKIRNWGEAMLANPQMPKSWALLPRLEYPLLQAGTLEAEYRRRQAAVADMIARGEANRDTRLRDYLRALVPDAVRPDLLRASIGLS